MKALFSAAAIVATIAAAPASAQWFGDDSNSYPRGNATWFGDGYGDIWSRGRDFGPGYTGRFDRHNRPQTNRPYGWGGNPYGWGGNPYYGKSPRGHQPRLAPTAPFTPPAR